MLLVRESSPIPKAGTWYLNRSKKHVSRQARAILSATHLEHDFNRASQGRGPVAATFVHFGFGNAAKDIVLGHQRNRGQTAQKSTALSSIYVPTFGRHGDASNHGKRPWRHNFRPWGTYMTTCYQSMVHVKSYLKFHACKAPLGAAGTKSRFKIFTMGLHDET